MGAAVLIGRETQLRALARVSADACNGRARTALVHGVAGSGKTTLLKAVIDSAAGSMRTIQISGHPAEQDLPLAAVHQLLHRAGAAEMTMGGGRDPLRDASALLSLLTSMAREKPLLLVVDDAQWLDQASLRALIFVGRRLDADAVCLLFAMRPTAGWPFETDLQVEVGPLTMNESRRLLREAFPDISHRVAERIATASHGTPLVLHEVPRELTESQRAGTEPLPAELPLGRALDRMFSHRLAALPDRTRLAMLAAAFDTLKVATYRSVLSDLGCTLDDLDRAERAGLVRVLDGACEFHHPLVSAAIRSTATGRELAAVHRALAAAAHDDPVRRAHHLRKDPDAEPQILYEALRVGARTAEAAHSHAEAANLWQNAAEVAPDADAARALHREAVRCLARAGAGAEARELIVELLTEAKDDVERAGLLRELTTVSLWTRTVGPSHQNETEEFGTTLLHATEPPRRAAGIDLLTTVATAALAAGDYRRARRVGRILLDQGGAELSLEQRLLSDVTAVMAGEPDGGSILRGTPWVADYPWRQVADPSTSSGFITVVLGWLGEFELLREVIERCRAAIHEHGTSASGIYIMGSMTPSHERHLGRWDRALLEFEALQRIVIDTDFSAPYPFIALRHAHLLASRGDREGCRELQLRAREQAPTWAPHLAHLDHAVSGLLALSHRDFEEALTHLTEAGRIETEIGLAPSGYLSRFPDAFEAAWRLGQEDRLLPELKVFETSMRAIRHPGMEGLALRCRALDAPVEDMDQLFEQSVALLAREPDGFEVARTRLLWGERLRRARRKADAHLTLAPAQEAFTRLGATRWADQCSSELAACGIRRVQAPEVGDGLAGRLTPREFEVAREVATGVTNAVAAQRLFISERTVEFHLSSVFRKLDITGREELASVLDT
ncbi:AAA family ATPase [Nocardioides sp. AE5]|uniref:helix-turn-helix transcriptional regulator n=1 Tax=Nocardioides sp. AE5 TaxID=2962573 RepID=UPI0028818BBB|nr:AAA family ATPase [Nocardioides sp. AE5]MDT0202747.1 AAA family ATPase [Nocardioides sp. AE5]